MGRVLFYVLWPLFWFFSPLTRRTRVLIIYKDEFIAVKNSIGPNIWQLPGGGIKFGESVEEASIREVNEELGLELENLRVLNQEAVIVRQSGLLLRLNFAVSEIKNKENFSKQWEISDAKWLPLDTDEILASEVKEAFKLVDKQG